jgi:hypothetical protein
MPQQPCAILLQEVQEQRLGIQPCPLWMRPHAQCGFSFGDQLAQRHCLRCLRRIGLELLRLIVGNQRIHDGLQTSLHDQVKLM